MAFRPPENTSLRTNVANEIMRAIAEGHLQPGDRVIEQQIATEMEISRAPVREAIRELEAQGILVTIDRKGAFVADLTSDDIKELFALRIALETMAIEIAAARINQAQIQELITFTEEMVFAASKNDVDAFVESDMKFHNLVCSLSNRKRLLRMLDEVRTLIRMFMVISKFAMLYSTELAHEAAAHKPIIEALSSGNPDKAKDALAKHLTQAEAILLRYFEQKTRKKDA